ncbi:MAG TPA: BTAD domain-containing putative transcriptional regulator [Baekduia sp.]|uniref:AfsR/SARP family transcriptional regulator n=1 Tax=Baekduia sp. TaxID=2600305 RepID=UPI002C88D1A5|nr:BTAD domain-containing putative transcriptional regulator [Baekduia sp.]HMJ33072.1 BTAD domain-containing putative transcriptional regulator [Baekduia sp.]
MSELEPTDSEVRAFTDAGLAVELVDRYPYAILVQDREGRLVAYNQAARRMLGRWVALEVGSRVGCLIIGCRRPGGRLQEVCLHERAARHAGPLPELRIGLPGGAGAEAAWATVMAFAPGRELIVTELRPEIVHPPQEPGGPPWTGGPRLRVFVLGRTCVMNGDRLLGGRWIDNRAGHILKLLVAERHRSVFSDEIVARLWPAAASLDTRGLRYFVHVLREQLEPDGSPTPPSSFVRATRGGYAIDSERVWVDADAFEELVTEGLAAYEADDDRAAELLRRGVELYRGEFLADEPYAEWAFHERDRLRDIASDGLRALASLDEHAGDLTRATSTLTRLAELEPFDVDVHRELFALLLRRGRRSEALRRYETLRRRMLSTFDEPLDFSLSQLT